MKFKIPLSYISKFKNSFQRRWLRWRKLKVEENHQHQSSEEKDHEHDEEHHGESTDSRLSHHFTFLRSCGSLPVPTVGLSG